MVLGPILEPNLRTLALTCRDGFKNDSVAIRFHEELLPKGGIENLTGMNHDVFVMRGFLRQM